MRRQALIALASVLLFGVFWAWPAFHQPAADHTWPASEEADGIWSYKMGSRSWDCTSQGWHIGRYGFGGI
jgi:hypothetical protein